MSILASEALLHENKKYWKSVRITHAGSWMVCKQYIILNHVLSEKTASFPKLFPTRFPAAFFAAFPVTFSTEILADDLHILKNSHRIFHKISRIIFHRIFHKISCSICLKISHRISSKISHSISFRISHKISHSISRKISHRIWCKISCRISYRISQAGCWLVSSPSPIPNAKFPPITALLNRPTYHKSANVSHYPLPNLLGTPNQWISQL